MSENAFKYYAFISYSHKDQKIAQKLQKRIESYHLPTALQKSNPELPKKLRPVFIDEANLVATGSLGTSLKTHLEQSRYLIVICSPNSAQSEYVNDEVEYFIKSGRIDNIIPVIVDGQPHSTDKSLECFPPALLALPRELEPLGFDVKKHGMRGAFLRVIASMLRLNLDAFLSREKLERRKRNAVFSLAAAVTILIAGFFVWHNIPHYHYYHTYVYKWGKPIGLFEVKSDNDRMKMEYTYKFTSLRGKVQSIERVNSAGILVDPSAVTPLLELPMIKFVSDGVSEYYDAKGRKIYKQVYINPQIVDFYCGDADVSYALPSDTYDYYNSSKYNPEFSNNQNSGNIRRMTLEYDENGYVIKKIFRRETHGGRDKKGVPAQDKNGRWGFEYKLDDLGRIIEVRNLGRDGTNIDIKGIYADYVEYGDTPYPVKNYHTDRNGKLIADQRGVALDKAEFDEYFNVKTLSFYDADEKPVFSTEYNIFQCAFTHDPDSGFLTSVSYYDTELKPCMHREGISRMEFTRDKSGRETYISFYDVDGKKCMCSDGYASAKYDYDSAGQISSEAFFDINGQPVVNSTNVYAYKYHYKDGLLVRMEYFNADGKPMFDKYGGAAMEFFYDKDVNKLIMKTYKDTDNKNVLSSYGYAEARYEYDDGNVISEAYYDTDGKPVTNSLGVARYVSEWRDGNLISQKCLGTDGNLTLNADGYAKVNYEYDENGLKIWERYYDADDKRVMLSNRAQRRTAYGHSAVKYTYDERGYKTSETFYDNHDNYAVKIKEYYCYAKKYEYDAHGNIKHIEYIKDENSPYKDMIDKQVRDEYFEYDNRGNQIKHYWLNGKGEEVDSKSSPNGTVRYAREYDIYGREIRILSYWKGDNQVDVIDENEYDALGRKTATRAVRHRGDIEDMLTAKYEYDAYGRSPCKTYYMDGDNNLIIPSHKYKDLNLDYAIKEVRRDIFGHETDIWCYDENKKPLKTAKRAFHTVKTYDVKGNVLTESYFDDIMQNNPAALSNGVHKKVKEYDASGHDIKISLYDIKDKLIIMQEKGYNSLGKLEYEQSYDLNGKPLYTRDGYFKAVYAYDSYGNITDAWYFDADGKPCMCINDKGKEICHHLKRSFDAMGHRLSYETFDAEGKPYSISGIYKIMLVYNSYGLRSETAYYDKEGHLFKKRLFKYNSDGKKIAEELVDANGNKIK